MSADLNWLIIRNNHAYLHKKKNIKQPFSSEPGNLKNVNSFRYNGLVNKKTVDIRPEPQGKGFELTLRTTRHMRKPSKNYNKTTFKSGPRRALFKLRRQLSYSNYRRDLLQTALRRASAILMSQKPKPTKSRRKGKREEKAEKPAKSGKSKKSGKASAKSE